MNYTHIFYAQKAEQDILSIVEYIAKDNYKKAIEYRNGIVDTIEKLLIFPLGGKKYDNEFRRLKFKRHYIFYHLNETNKSIQIHHVRHDRQLPYKPYKP